MNYKIVCICQVYNEIEKDNLERFFTYLKPLVDEIVIYDDCSTDGSFEYAGRQTPHVIRGIKNDFASEATHRQLMLDQALKLGAEFILWLDADEVLTASSRQDLQNLCDDCIKSNVDGVNFHELNIWRSSTWRRIDSWFDEGWFTRLWRVQPSMKFMQLKRGLHQSLLPSSIKAIEYQNKIGILHYGFASEKSLAYKYLIYHSHGQRGYEKLDRLISEDTLELIQIDKELFPDGLWVDNEKPPTKISFIDALSYVSAYKNKVFRPKYSIVCLIYKSVDWLELVYKQVLQYTDLTDTEFFFVANDANEDVIKYLRDNYIPYFNYQNTEEQKREWYINNVYRAWNYSAKVARGDFIIFINSDMCFTPGWLDELKAAYDGSNLVTSRLVESGKLRSGQYGIEENFGRNFSEYNEAGFLQFAESIREDKVLDGGLYMPLLVKKEHFVSIGGYPEGNIKRGSDIFSNEIALQTDLQISGDAILMQRMATIGIKHQTSFRSIVYHFQCGEMDEKVIPSFDRSKLEIAVCNDICNGSMGERVLWNYMLESLPGAYPVDKAVVGVDDYESKAANYINAQKPNTSIIIQNATFISFIDPSRHTIAFLQDDLRKMERKSAQQEFNLRMANTLVTNSLQTALSYPEYDFEIIPVGVDSDLFVPQSKSDLRKKYQFGAERIGIFVGCLSEVKGWSKVSQCIKMHPEITWILVSKHEETYQADNVRLFNRIDQKQLAELLNCADFFIIGSPVETQCLAAIEANLCDIPVVMPLVGIYRDFTVDERAKVGIFGDDLAASVMEVARCQFSPRAQILEKDLTVQASMKKWHMLIERIVRDINCETVRTHSDLKRHHG